MLKILPALTKSHQYLTLHLLSRQILNPTFPFLNLSGAGGRHGGEQSADAQSRSGPATANIPDTNAHLVAKNTASPHQLHMRSIGHNVPHTDGHRDLVSSVTQRHVVVTVVTFRIQSLVS